MRDGSRHRFQVHELVVSLALQVRQRAAEFFGALTQLGDQSLKFG